MLLCLLDNVDCLVLACVLRRMSTLYLLFLWRILLLLSSALEIALGNLLGVEVRLGAWLPHGCGELVV